MSIGEFIALCPSCDATLTVTEKGLYGHKGQVRCGKCHTVFYAPDSLLKGVFDEQQISRWTVSDTPLTAYAESVVTEVLPSVDATQQTQITHNSATVSHDATIKDGGGFYDNLSEVKNKLSQNQVNETSVYHIDEIGINQQATSTQINATQRRLAEQYARARRNHTQAQQYKPPRNNNYKKSRHASYISATARMPTTQPSSIKWVLLCLLMLLVLLIQYLWIKRSVVYQNATLHPLYHVLCSIAPCDVGAFLNRKSIQVAVTMISKNTTSGIYPVASFKGTVKNTAYAEQTFPVLQVLFFDTNKQAIFEQTVYPNKYLKNHTLTYFMPINQAVNVAFTTRMPYNMYAYSVQVDRSQ